ncbi:hypothetical protein TWF225_003924 [Orbilia oligospora]|uniref:Uncharacterized protein n=1 Tax=Orbilia oligospora TaxID=2813651 RepID=A0A7C8U254_ORBOL|nr:hypothetical protein TWF751_000017 [Orbilia oligospora]KAF3188159.1 hypothetical protein TWF225_003924 [Orbilia oligospora]KAF3232721.1 hypothetical protein TWF128_003721 [Orbilia oligospora]KAF3234943.1 hypothetical protein TWF217_003379 [Orbilia oligospora]KAF3295570.1 hypothetical protein TWF132_001608 [Orbilia oligospora]
MSAETSPLMGFKPLSPSRESTFSSPVDPSSARMKILVAPYYSPYVVSLEKVQTWEGLILMLQRLFGPTFCSLDIPPTITLHTTEEAITAENWIHIVCEDCCIVVHTRSEDTGPSPSQQVSPRPATSGSMTARVTPKSRDGTRNDISGPISGPTSGGYKEQKAKFINRHANSGFDTPNLFDGRNFTPEEPVKEKPAKRKRRGTLWNTVLNVISIVSPTSSSSSNQTTPVEPIPTIGTVTHISAVERKTSRKLSQKRRVKSKRSSVIMQAPTTTTAAGRPLSMAREPREPLKPKFSAGNIMRLASKRQKKRRSIPPPAQHVRRHIAKSGSDCSTCFGDDKNRDSIIVAARLASDPKAPIVTTGIPPVSSTPSPRSRDNTKLTILERPEKTDSITIFSSPVIEEFSLQPKNKFRPPSSAAATKTSSIYYESSAPPVPRRDSQDDTGFNSQYKLLDERLVRSVVYKAVASRKVEEEQRREQPSARSSHRSEASGKSLHSSKSQRTPQRTPSSDRHQNTRSTTAAPKRSKSMGAGALSSPSLSARRSAAPTPSSTSRSGSANAIIDSSYNTKHSSTGSRAGTVRSSGSRASSYGGFVRQSTPFDNKPLPRLPDEAAASSSTESGRRTASPTPGGIILMPPIATFEDLMSKTSSTISESVEINSYKRVTMVAGHPELQ